MSTHRVWKFCFLCFCALDLPSAEAGSRDLWSWREEEGCWLRLHHLPKWDSPNPFSSFTQYSFSSFEYLYGEEEHPVALWPFPTIERGSSLDLPCSHSSWRNEQDGGYALRFGGYLSLREEIKEMLRRLGVVSEEFHYKTEEGMRHLTEAHIHFHHPLSVSYVVHHWPEGFGNNSLGRWRCHAPPDQDGLRAAVKIIPLSPASIAFTPSADQPKDDDPRSPRIASLPNGFFLRTIRRAEEATSPQTSPWQMTRVAGNLEVNDDNGDTFEGLAFAAIVLLPDGRVEVAVELILPLPEDELEPKVYFNPSGEKIQDMYPSVFLGIEYQLNRLMVSDALLEDFYVIPEESDIGFPSAAQDLRSILQGDEVANLQALLTLGADARCILEDNGYSTQNYTLLSRVVCLRHPELARILLEKGADPNGEFYFTGVRLTPLLAAVATNNPEMLELLLQYGADVQAILVDADGQEFTPLQIAAGQAVQIQRRRYTRDESGLTSFLEKEENWVENPDPRLVMLLRAHGAREEPPSGP
ncbi:MAG: ankyrin repeat domain-containing protein [Puniceicoccales bacterium]|nr:ankyrin repeat domain-containing protein [Puniceicoccales bacterium]